MRLPGSACAIDDVCRALGLSRRTLQRKLKEENTSFQQQLNHTRELLTKNYLRNTTLSAEDIAYLLGYQDLNSFYRALSLWTGKSILSALGNRAPLIDARRTMVYSERAVCTRAAGGGHP